MNDMYATIGGFNIKISLGKITSDPTTTYLQNKAEIDLLIYLKSFLSHRKLKKIDFEIEFTDIKDPQLLSIPSNNTMYLPIFTFVNDNKVTTYFQLGIFQFETVLKNVLLMILKRNGGFGIHASCAKVGGNAYLFLAESGGGKSTSTELLKDEFPTLNDDITLIRKLGSKYYVFQTPFIEKPWWIRKSSKLYPVGKIFFLHKSAEFKVKPIPNRQPLTANLLKQVIAAQNPDKNVMKNVKDFVRHTNNFYDLYFEKNSEELIKLISHI